MGHGILIVKASRLRTGTPHSVGLLWTRDQLDAETTHNTHKRHTSMSPAGFEPAIPIKRPHLCIFRVIQLFRRSTCFRFQGALNLPHVIMNHVGFGEQRHGVTRHQGCGNSWSIVQRSWEVRSDDCHYLLIDAMGNRQSRDCAACLDEAV